MEQIEYRKENGIATIVLNRPDKQNAISRKMNDELWQASAVSRRMMPHILPSLTGSGDRAFCAGADLADYIPGLLRGQRKRRAGERQDLGSVTSGWSPPHPEADHRSR